MKALTIHLSLIALFTLAACSDDGTSPPDQQIPRDGAAEGTTPDASLIDLGPTPDAAPTASVCGYLEDPQGVKVQGADIIVCNDTECYTDTSGQTGAFCVQIAKAADYLFHAAEKKGAKHYAEVYFGLVVSADQLKTSAKVDVGTVIQPEVSPSVNLDPKVGGTINLAGGCKLVVPPGAAKLSALSTTADVAYAAVEMAQVHKNVIDALPGGVTLKAAYLTVPVGVSFTPSVDFELPAPSGLGEGTLLDLYWIDDEKGGPAQKVGEAKVSGGKLVNISGKGIAHLGWLLFTS